LERDLRQVTDVTEEDFETTEGEVDLLNTLFKAWSWWTGRCTKRRK
jgi:hypothetical protein